VVARKETYKHINTVKKATKIVIVCYFVCSLMEFICQEIKGLLTYLL